MNQDPFYPAGTSEHHITERFGDGEDESAIDFQERMDMEKGEHDADCERSE